MNTKKSSASKNLTVDPAASVNLDITIGNGQIGGSQVYFKNSPGTIIAKGDISNLSLGLGANLVGKTLEIVTNILDSNTATLGVVVTYYFEGCTPASTTISNSVDSSGDIFSLTIDFNFK